MVTRGTTTDSIQFIMPVCADSKQVDLLNRFSIFNVFDIIQLWPFGLYPLISIFVFNCGFCIMSEVIGTLVFEGECSAARL